MASSESEEQYFFKKVFHHLYFISMFPKVCKQLGKIVILSRLLVGNPLVLGPEPASRRAEHSPFLQMSLYIFVYYLYHLICLCV